jgi:hypothetical protein
MRRLLRFGLALLLPACASPLAEARSSFQAARYPDAAAQYRALAPSVARLSAPELFDYALHRGLCHLALGDAVPAQRWLTVAKRLSERAPHLATPEQAGRLMAAWRSMGFMPGD